MLADAIDTDPADPFELDLVLGRPEGPGLHPAAAATLELLDGIS
jgi:hypothetical protein